MSTTISGVFVPMKNETGGHVWQKITKNTREGKLYEVKRRWTLWFSTPHGIAEGTWVEVEGLAEVSVAYQLGEDGKPLLDAQGRKVISTWTDKTGLEVPNFDWVLYGPELKRVEAPKVEKPRDLDDEAKYAPF